MAQKMSDLNEKIANSKILVVGAGGIGCELLKNLAGTGFKNIDVIDLDTIEYSNLNRQFLFQREHVGKPKAQVAADSVQKFASNLSINYFHKSVIDPEFDVNYFKQFTFVMNALDNTAARNHVNRLCLAADVYLIESGSAGYLGQTTVIKKGITECYECQPKAPQKTFPACTIRNTPSEPIHCVVWAKHLFNQLFGEIDPDEDVSPDINDSELNPSQNQNLASGDAEMVQKNELNGHESNSESGPSVEPGAISTRKWVTANNYDPRALFQKLFVDDVTYLLSMSNLWKKREPPKPLNFDSIMQMNEKFDNQTSGGDSAQPTSNLDDQKTWSLKQCLTVFIECIIKLKHQLDRLNENSILAWDKDNEVCMDFVTACTNLRSSVFNIPKKSRFDIKSMAGNIIPAIATTNAIVAGLMVMEILKILSNRLDDCATTYLLRKPNYKGNYFAKCSLCPPNPNCYVCSSKPEVYVKLNCSSFTVKSLEEKILKQNLHMVAPDVEIEDNKGTIIISSEKGEISDLDNKTLSELNIGDWSRLNCDDFNQHFELRLIIINSADLLKDVEFEILTDTSTLKASDEPSCSNAQNLGNEEDELFVLEESMEALKSGSSTTKKRKFDQNEDQEIEIESPKRSKIV